MVGVMLLLHAGCCVLGAILHGTGTAPLAAAGQLPGNPNGPKRAGPPVLLVTQFKYRQFMHCVLCRGRVLQRWYNHWASPA